MHRPLPPLDLEATAIGQLEQLVEALTQASLPMAGLILHGSAAMSGFEPGRSDLDVLAIVASPLDSAGREAIGAAVLGISGRPHPLEISVLLEADLSPWIHPCRHEFHFGESLRQRFERASPGGEPFATETPTDVDLAMHLTVARARGIDLLGTWPVRRLPAVPRHDFLAAIADDFDWAAAQGASLEAYLRANACRTLAYLDAGLILSKTEGVRWCRDQGVDSAGLIARVRERIRTELAAGALH